MDEASGWGTRWTESFRWRTLLLAALAVLAALWLMGCAQSPASPTATTVTPTPTAKLTIKGDLVFEDVPAGWLMHATGVNTGDACAEAITGTTTIRSATATYTYDWSVPAPIIRPTESFTYTFGPMSEADALKLGSDATYTTAFRFRNRPC